jgi:hypothetical protein
MINKTEEKEQVTSEKIRYSCDGSSQILKLYISSKWINIKHDGPVLSMTGVDRKESMSRDVLLYLCS